MRTAIGASVLRHAACNPKSVTVGNGVPCFSSALQKLAEEAWCENASLAEMADIQARCTDNRRVRATLSPNLDCTGIAVRACQAHWVQTPSRQLARKNSVADHPDDWIITKCVVGKSARAPDASFQLDRPETRHALLRAFESMHHISARNPIGRTSECKRR